MKKFYLLFFLLLAGLLGEVSAKKGTIVLKGKAAHQVFSISPNGKYACGNFDDNGLTKGFLWNLESNTYTYLSGEGSSSEANSVSNDGTVCGVFVTAELSSSGALQESGGYWKDGKVYLLKDEEGKPILSAGRAITPDGQYIAGVIINKNRYLPALWKNGILQNRLETNGKDGNVNAISDDGHYVMGWYTTSNRTACYWNPELVTLSNKASFFCTAYDISSNNRYILAHDTDGKFVYDLTTNKRMNIPYLDDPYNDGGMQVLNDGTSIVWETPDQSGLLNSTSYIYRLDGTHEKLQEWIKENMNADLPEETEKLGIACVTEDMQTIIGLIKDAADMYYPLAFRGGVEVEHVKPAYVQAEQVPATSAIMIKWEAPLENSSAVTGYRIYRNGNVFANVAKDEFVYVDENPGASELRYEIAALYGENESPEKVEASVTLKDMSYAPVPLTFTAYQSNYNNVTLNWTAPATGHDALVRLHNGVIATQFGANIGKTYWAGVNFNHYLVDCYYDKFQLYGIEFYPYDKVSQLTLTIMSGDEILVEEQEIDQSKLILGQANIIPLSQPVSLPKGEDVKVIIKVVQKSGSLAVIGMAQEPAVEGGNLIAENEGVWTDLMDLSAGAYPYNWAIGMILDATSSTSGLPSGPVTLAANRPVLTGYKIYHNGELIRTIEDAELVAQNTLHYADANVTAERHTYGIEALYNQSQLVSELKETAVNISSKYLTNCPAPVNVKAAAGDKTHVALSWDTPEMTTVGYTNWELQGGVYYADLTDWYYGVAYDIEKLTPYVGFSIERINFWPLIDATFTLHIYVNEELFYSQPIKNYKLKKLNTVKLDEPIIIETGKKYMVSIQVENTTPNVGPLGLDTTYPHINGRLISEDGSYFINGEWDMTGNLMINMEVEKTTPGYNPGLTYKIYADDREVGTASSNAFEMTFDNPDTDRNVKFNVAAVYPNAEKKSEDVVLLIGPSEINQNEISTVKVYPNPTSSYIKIEGNVSEVSLVNVAGQEIYHDNNVNTINVTGFQPGIYLLKMLIEGETYIHKVQIIK